MNRDPHETLSTADLAAADERRAKQPQDMKRNAREATAEVRDARTDDARAGQGHDEQLAPLFSTENAQEFRQRWDQIQFGFVDDPKRAVREGDELVAQVMKSLAQSFSQERTRLEHELSNSGAGEASTENLRMALRRYRSFFHRLLSL